MVRFSVRAFLLTDWWLSSCILACQWEKLFHVSYKCINSFLRTPPSWPDHLPKALCLNAVKLGVRISGTWGNTFSPQYPIFTWVIETPLLWGYLLPFRDVGPRISSDQGVKPPFMYKYSGLGKVWHRSHKRLTWPPVLILFKDPSLSRTRNHKSSIFNILYVRCR